MNLRRRLIPASLVAAMTARQLEGLIERARAGDQVDRITLSLKEPIRSVEQPHTDTEVAVPDQVVRSETSSTGSRVTEPSDMVVGGTTAVLIQIPDHNRGLLTNDGPIDGPDFMVTVREGSASSFQRRRYRVYPHLFKATPIPGTRIRLQFNNVQAGVHIFVPVEVDLLITGTSTITGKLTLIVTDASGNAPPLYTPVVGIGGLAEVDYKGTTGYATYEVVNCDPKVIDSARINVYVAFFTNMSQDLPRTGYTTLTAGFAPTLSAKVPDPASAIARFYDAYAPRNAFVINSVACSLLFPFVTSTGGSDTRIVITNTSLDPFGTPRQKGDVTLYFYGNTEAEGQAQERPVVAKTQPMRAGQQLAFRLSTGGNGVPPMPDFQGYVVAVAHFQYCHAFASISDAGAESQGYLAIPVQRGGEPGGEPSES